MSEGILTKGVQCKQWDPGIARFGETLQVGLMKKVNLFHNGFMLQFSYMMNKFAALYSASAWGQADLGGEDCHVPIFWDIKSDDHDEIPRVSNWH